jgi:hypothetical protein
MLKRYISAVSFQSSQPGGVVYVYVYMFCCIGMRDLVGMHRHSGCMLWPRLRGGAQGGHVYIESSCVEQSAAALSNLQLF